MTALKLNPSAANRWSKCTASLLWGELLPDDRSSKAADLGTRVHAAIALLAGAPTPQREMEIAKLSLDEESLGRAIGFVNWTRDLRADTSWHEWRLDHPNIPELRGTADYVALRGRDLIVVDYKNGTEIVPVETEGRLNLQLVLYAAMALSQPLGNSAVTIRDRVDRVVLVIYQPARGAEPCSSVAVDPDTIHATTSAATQYPRSAISSRSRNDKFTAEYGSHCRYCPGKSLCPTWVAGANAEFGKDLPALAAATVDSSDTALGTLWPVLKRTETTIAELLAVIKARLIDNRIIPGVALRSSGAMKRWSDDIDTKVLASKLKRNGVESPWVKSLVTPAAAAKLVGKDVFAKTFSKELVLTEKAPSLTAANVVASDIETGFGAVDVASLDTPAAPSPETLPETKEIEHGGNA